MTWSYSGDPSTSDKDAVRFTIGDIDTNNQLLQDEEINYLLTTHGSVSRASYFAALSISAKCAQLTRQETGRIKVWAGEKYKQYKDFADQLKENIDKGFGQSPQVYAGGISILDMEKNELDCDRYSIDVEVGMHNNDKDPNPGC